MDIRTLQARTGHAQASTLVNIYSHALKSAQEAASDAERGQKIDEFVATLGRILK